MVLRASVHFALQNISHFKSKRGLRLALSIPNLSALVAL